MKYKVLKITNNLKEYPECKDDTEMYPELVSDVSDEMDNFIIDESGRVYPAEEFFDMVGIKKFFSEI